MSNTTDPFVSHILEMMTDFGQVTARKMFGGYGIYHAGIMFALIADETLYLKVDQQSKPIFERQGLQPFTYDGHKKPVVMSYNQAPDSTLDDPDDMREWAQRGYDAACRAKKDS